MPIEKEADIVLMISEENACHLSRLIGRQTMEDLKSDQEARCLKGVLRAINAAIDEFRERPDEG